MMALTQSARLPRPSWEEEVVPALRKRLESESRTLARRISAISLSESLDEHQQGNQFSTTSVTAAKSRKQQPSTAYNGHASQQQYLPSSSQSVQPSYQEVQFDRTMSNSTATSKASNTRENGASSSKPPFQRPRTYSSPYGSEFGNAGVGRPKPSQVDHTRALSPRPTDIKPTRIPKVANRSHSGSTSQPNSPYVNGYGHTNPNTNYAVTPPLPSPEVPPLPEATFRGIPPSSSSRSTLEISGRSGIGTRQQPTGLMNEPAPFPTDATTSSGFSQSQSFSQHGHGQEEDPPRASMESEERPFEHWYRGEVSRNGGVGELRVGRRQEMLDIANYGHLINKKDKPRTTAAAAALASRHAQETHFMDEAPVRRKRAGSIAGMTDMERGSLYLDDDERADRADRVLDENPLTDLEGDVSDATSISDRFQTVRQRYEPPSTEEHPLPSDPRTTTKDYSGIGEGRSTTPTALSMSRSASANRQVNLPPTRIPGPSSRRSSESRPGNKTPTPPLVGSTSTNLSSSTSSNTRLQQQQSTTSKRGVSPAPGSSSTNRKSPGTPNPNSSLNKTPPTPSKSTASIMKKGTPTKKPKTKPKRTKEEEEAYRRSVAYYPPMDGDADEGDMADAIPSWTQPIHKAGNWDEVVLPVVARKKGLDDHYENADGTPQPRKEDKTVAPAPGTFGYDHTKYRRAQFEESIPMDEFGRPHEEENNIDPNSIPEEDATPKPHFTTPHDEIRLPTRPYPPPSPVPFSSYAPTSVQVGKSPAPSIIQHETLPTVEKQVEEPESAGCCSCVIM